jgi:hypothetical protein
MDVRLNISPEALEELTWEQMEVLDRGITKAEARDFCALFVVDAEGKRLPHAEAYAFLGKLKGPQMAEVLEKFTEAIKAMQVPPEKPSE